MMIKLALMANIHLFMIFTMKQKFWAFGVGHIHRWHSPMLKKKIRKQINSETLCNKIKDNSICHQGAPLNSAPAGVRQFSAPDTRDGN